MKKKSKSRAVSAAAVVHPLAEWISGDELTMRLADLTDRITSAEQELIWLNAHARLMGSEFERLAKHIEPPFDPTRNWSA